MAFWFANFSAENALEISQELFCPHSMISSQHVSLLTLDMAALESFKNAEGWLDEEEREKAWQLRAESAEQQRAQSAEQLRAESAELQAKQLRTQVAGLEVELAVAKKTLVRQDLTIQAGERAAKQSGSCETPGILSGHFSPTRERFMGITLLGGNSGHGAHSGPHVCYVWTRNFEFQDKSKIGAPGLAIYYFTFWHLLAEAGLALPGAHANVGKNAYKKPHT